MTIALAGNPNSGKTTLFNALTDSNQFVGNWPGVTVEKKEGRLKSRSDVTVTDLPGIYSLSPYTPEEVISRRYLLETRSLSILNIIDGTNLERNLYLTTQFQELGVPIVLAVNMADILERSGIKIDLNALSSAFGCPVVGISALKGTNVMYAAELAAEIADSVPPESPLRFGAVTERAIAEISALLPPNTPNKRFAAIKLFERDELTAAEFANAARKAETIIRAAELTLGDDSESIIANGRYVFVERIVKKCMVRSDKPGISAKIDGIIMNRILAIPLFIAIIMAVYYLAVGSVGAFVTKWTNEALFGEIVPGVVGKLLERANAAAWQRGLILDGILGGVGAVLGFVPQMLILFFMLSFLEACGYMARIAFILDKVFRRFGLSGKSFIPFLVATGCGVPGIMASRTIENESERRATIITATFMPCSAKLPVIALFAGALFGGSGLVAGAAYIIGIGGILVSGLILKRLKAFRGGVSPFVMELPNYRMPTLGNLLRNTWDRGVSFIKKAGTLIMLSSCVVWFLSGFGFVDGKFRMVDDLQYGLLATVGNMFSWIFLPLGFGNWEATVSVFTGIMAKENIVATLGVLYGVNGIESAFSPVTGFAFLMFNLLCVPCVAAIGAIRREMNSAKWTLGAIGYQCGFAYAIALIIKIVGGLIWR